MVVEEVVVPLKLEPIETIQKVQPLVEMELLAQLKVVLSLMQVVAEVPSLDLMADKVALVDLVAVEMAADQVMVVLRHQLTHKQVPMDLVVVQVVEDKLELVAMVPTKVVMVL